MEKLLEQAVNHPLFLLITGISTIVALIITIAALIVQRKRKQLRFDYNASVVVTDESSGIVGLDVHYNKERVNQLYVTNMKIHNDGNIIIEEQDVYKGHELKIRPKNKELMIIWATIVSQSSDTIKCNISISEDCVGLSFQTFEKKDSVVINIYHKGGADANFALEGKIKEGKIINSRSKRKTLNIGTRQFISVALLVMIIVIGIVLLMPFLGLIIYLLVLYLFVSTLLSIIFGY